MKTKPKFPTRLNGLAKNKTQSKHPNLWDGLQGLWMPSTGVQGMGIQDISNHNNHASLNFMTAADWQGDGLESDGFNDYALVDNGEADLTTDVDFSVSLWVHYQGGGNGNGVFMAKEINGIAAPFNLKRKDQQLKISMKLGNGTTETESTAIGMTITDDWVLVTSTVRKTATDTYEVKIYKNDRLIGTSSVSQAINTTGDEVTFFSNVAKTEDYAGIQDHMAIWNRVLSHQEIMSMYAGASPVIKRKQTVGFVAAVGGSVIKTFNGLANASTKTWGGLANASIKTLNGVSNV